MMKKYSEIVECREEHGKYQVSVETNDVALLKHVSEMLKNQLQRSGKQYRIEYRIETNTSSFIRWLLS
jgi:hypothetical protein